MLKVWIPCTFWPATFLCLSQAKTWISNAICRGLFMYNSMMSKVVVRFVQVDCWSSLFNISVFFYIGGIVDHHCLEMVVRFVDIGWIVDNCCLEVIVRFVHIGGEHGRLNFPIIIQQCHKRILLDSLKVCLMRVRAVIQVFTQLEFFVCLYFFFLTHNLTFLDIHPVLVPHGRWIK
jgi:hypothetical protein